MSDSDDIPVCHCAEYYGSHAPDCPVRAAVEQVCRERDELRTINPAWADVSLQKLVHIQVGGCTCETKTPELAYHREDCHYRLASEIDDLVRAASKAIAADRKELLERAERAEQDAARLRELLKLCRSALEPFAATDILDRIDRAVEAEGK